MTTDCHSSINYRDIDSILETFDYNKSYLIAMLQKVQEIYKYLPEDAMT